MQTPSVGVAIVTLQAESCIASCLMPLLQSDVNPKIVVIDSSSTDKTVEIARQFGVKTVVIPQKEFNHGLTREKARKLLNTDIVVFLTQDAFLVDGKALEKLIAPIVNKSASVTYARQLPHVGADIFESFHREFNYPPESQLRKLQDAEKYGVYTCFCSDSCAAYDNFALDEIGGFPEALFGEDTLAAAKLILSGKAVCYTADAQVKHSHRYTLLEEFYRHFDIGLYRKTHTALFSRFGSDSKRGMTYMAKLLIRLFEEKPWLIPYAIAQTGMKWLGYRLGKLSVGAPLWLKRRLSSQKYYWR